MEMKEDTLRNAALRKGALMQKVTYIFDYPIHESEQVRSL